MAPGFGVGGFKMVADRTDDGSQVVAGHNGVAVGRSGTEVCLRVCIGAQVIQTLAQHVEELLVVVVGAVGRVPGACELCKAVGDLIEGLRARNGDVGPAGYRAVCKRRGHVKAVQQLCNTGILHARHCERHFSDTCQVFQRLNNSARADGGGNTVGAAAVGEEEIA